MRDQACRVAYNRSVAPGYWTIGLETGWNAFVPGQFGMLQVPAVGGVLLRRPFSFARQIGTVTEILYKVVGKGTAALAEVNEGRILKLLGPLGKGFTVPEKIQRLVAVAGGYGIAPFLELARQLQKTETCLTVLYGARSKQDIIYNQEFNSYNLKLLIATEDGSAGHQGRVTELLATFETSRESMHLLSCGPTGLLAAVQAWAHQRNITCELSIEETMGCGTGVCLGCVVKDQEGHYRRACIEGPVFDGRMVVLS